MANTKQIKKTYSMDEPTLEKLDKLVKKTGLNKSMILRVLIKDAEDNKTIKGFIKNE